MAENLTDLLKRLVEAEVEFILVGGLAAVVHGSSLVTRDVDVVVVLSPTNLGKLHRALEGLSPRFKGASPPREFTLADAESRDWKNVYLETNLGGLDCLGEVKGIGDYEDCYSRSLILEFARTAIRVLDRDALIDSKRAMGRPHDLQAIAELEACEELLRERSDDERDPRREDLSS